MTPNRKDELERDRRGWVKRLLKVITTPEPFNAALGINYPLFAGVDGVAIAAHFDPHSGLGGAGVEYVAAGAGYHRVEELRMGISFHYSPLTSTGYTLTRRRPFAAHSNFTCPSIMENKV